MAPNSRECVCITYMYARALVCDIQSRRLVVVVQGNTSYFYCVQGRGFQGRIFSPIEQSLPRYCLYISYDNRHQQQIILGIVVIFVIIFIYVFIPFLSDCHCMRIAHATPRLSLSLIRDQTSVAHNNNFMDTKNLQQALYNVHIPFIYYNYN